jgi:membrane-associated protease RseP (regulator of RpoE activity)
MGIAIIILGLLVSIGLHEFGHLIPAKLFGVRVPNWAVGFGPKLFSKKIGETEYSFRLIPLGGYITMIGMYPPDAKGKDGKRRFGKMIAMARAAHSEHMQPGDAGVRTLYSLPAWKRITVMFGGPLTNLILGFVFVLIATVGVGGQVASTTVASVVPCFEQLEDSGAVCGVNSSTPAALAGIESGDRVISVNGTPVEFGAEVSAQVAQNPSNLKLIVSRVGAQQTIYVNAVAHTFTDGTVRNVVGLNWGVTRRTLSFAEGFNGASTIAGETLKSIVTFPQAVYSAIETTVTGKPRDTQGAISIVGVAQVAQVADDFYPWLMLLGSLNFALFAFNMLPMPPLDGGHIAGGVYEYLKRAWFRVRGKKFVGPVDTALMAPFAQIMFLVLLVAGFAVMFADFVNPILF